jgi:hypothetical protein
LVNQPPLAVSSQLVLPGYSPALVSSDDLISPKPVSLGSDAPASSDVVHIPDAVPEIRGLEIVESVSQPGFAPLVLHNPEPTSIVIFAGLCGPLAIGWLRRRNATVQPLVSRRTP